MFNLFKKKETVNKELVKEFYEAFQWAYPEFFNKLQNSTLDTDRRKNLQKIFLKLKKEI